MDNFMDAIARELVGTTSLAFREFARSVYMVWHLL